MHIHVWHLQCFFFLNSNLFSATAFHYFSRLEMLSGSTHFNRYWATITLKLKRATILIVWITELCVQATAALDYSLYMHYYYTCIHACTCMSISSTHIFPCFWQSATAFMLKKITLQGQRTDKFQAHHVCRHTHSFIALYCAQSTFLPGTIDIPGELCPFNELSILYFSLHLFFSGEMIFWTRKR